MTENWLYLHVIPHNFYVSSWQLVEWENSPKWQHDATNPYCSLLSTLSIRFRFLVLYTVYSSGLAVLYLSHFK